MGGEALSDPSSCHHQPVVPTETKAMFYYLLMQLNPGALFPKVLKGQTLNLGTDEQFL